MQGAEATLVRTNEGYRKERRPKRYRHPVLDAQLRKQRTRAEYRILAKASQAGVPVPSVQELDDTTLLIEEIDGTLLKDVLDEQPELAREVGEGLAKLHDADLIHGDLTTSNLIVTDTVFFIDFGLSFHSKRIEDKAVDVHVFKQALEAKHHAVFAEAYKAFCAGYGDQEVLKQLKQVEARGRNK